MASSESSFSDRSIAVVIVTYGDRTELLKKTLAGLVTSRAIVRIVIVDNGCNPELHPDVWGNDLIEIVRSPSNLGSAGGFSLGILAALKVKLAKFILVLDDDNIVERDFPAKILDLHAAFGGGDHVAIAALREDRPMYRDLLQNGEASAPRPGSFLGFHIGEIPKRMLGKLKKYGGISHRKVRVRQIYSAPYGGLFATIGAFRGIDPPRSDFVLYGDDHEFTQRMSDNGTNIFLTDLVTIRDAESSWNLPTSTRSHWIEESNPTWRKYYSARNHVFLEIKTLKGRFFIYKLNMIVFSTKLLVESILAYKDPRRAWMAFRPFKLGVSAGLQGQLGQNVEFPIPGSLAGNI